MRQMKNSGIEWIGQIPQEWIASRLKFYAEIDSGEMISKDEFDDNGEFSVIGSNGDIGRTNKCNNTKTVITTGRVGTVGTVQTVDKAWITDNALIIDPKIDVGFLKYVIPNFDFDAMLSGTAQPLITASKLNNQYIPLPSIEAQPRIAQYLDDQCAEIDALIEAKEKTNALLKERRQSTIYEAVTKGLNPDAPMKDSGIEWIGMIPAHWSVGKLGYFIDVFNGDRSSNYPSGNDIQESGVPFLTSSNLEFDVLDMSDSKYISEEKYASMSGLKMELDDIIYCLRGSVGKCSINKTETCGTVASSLMGIRCKKMVPDYLLFVLKSAVIETQNALFMNGTCAANLSAENVCGYLVPIPSEAEQREIATHLQGRCVEMDNLISANEATIQKLKEYRQSIIYEAVTGKIEI